MGLGVTRIYGPGEPDDRKRVLDDRLWPRGASSERAALDPWLTDVGPSNEPGRWFGHRDELWEEFQVGYRDESSDSPHLRALAGPADDGPVTLLCGAEDDPGGPGGAYPVSDPGGYLPQRRHLPRSGLVRLDRDQA